MTSFVRLVVPAAIQRPARPRPRLSLAALDLPTVAATRMAHRHDRTHIADARRMRDEAAAGLFSRFL